MTRDLAPLELVITTADATHTQRLPATGRLTIGRDPQNRVHLLDPSVSRRHAVLDLGPPLRIEDIGSSNGLRVTTSEESDGTARIVERRVSPGHSMNIELGDGMQLGATLLIVQRVNADDNPASSRVVRSFSVPVVHDGAMRKLYELVDLVSQSGINVLLLGETGVGKEVMAEAIHRRSTRARGPLVCLNCAAIHESLLESELFGHEAGAFTGATRAKPGLFEVAAGGTVFLDEVGELPISVQVKLLRVLEERKVLRVGGLQKRPLDVRFVSATNRNLEDEVARGVFRQDLYFRLNGVTMEIPPLRERTSEIEPIARSFIARAAVQMNMRAEPRLSPPALEALLGYGWPGNIRELRNVIERAVVLSAGGAILPEHLGLGGRGSGASSAGRKSSPELVTLPPPPPRPPSPRAVEQAIAPLRVPVGEDERQRIVEALELCGGNQSKAAEMLGISRRTLLTRLDLYGIPRPRKNR
ncbi:sigma 54-dependent Fis family transcriptional regulator [Polyangium sp. 6x1]|uniref:sigma 54-dependent Fis family transcriptional regulator n=1 Tax=Polyangium sp. 6x1 TaxID=3042689 RepID=UPI00248304E9|nr:sigma 54-dependent Fis family transcriptional regulator [Polyangium sp. 6x1]MDI1444539.1 sigma 54-dependent Fis family transcriptional regulator [Polyangium sp. 6x1]